MRSLGYSLTGASILASALLVGAEHSARAGAPPREAGADALPVVVIAEVVSLLGQERVILPGWVEVIRHPPRLEGGVVVVGLEIASLELRGASRLGRISVLERPDDGLNYVSGGEFRGLQPGERFPASSFLELFLEVDIDIPFSPGALHLHNQTALRLIPSSDGQAATLTGWPPLGVTYERLLDVDCVPLVASDNTETELGLCIESLDLQIELQVDHHEVEPHGAEEVDMVVVVGAEMPAVVGAPVEPRLTEERVVLRRGRW